MRNDLCFLHRMSKERANLVCFLLILFLLVKVRFGGEKKYPQTVNKT